MKRGMTYFSMVVGDLVFEFKGFFIGIRHVKEDAHSRIKPW